MYLILYYVVFCSIEAISFSLWEAFKLLIQFLYLLYVYSDFLFFLESVLVIYVFLRSCQFYLSDLICWHMVFHNILLFFFCKRKNSFLLVMLSVSFLILVIYIFYVFFLVSLAKSLSILLISSKKQKAAFGFIDFIYNFSILYFINFYSSLYYFSTSAYLRFSCYLFSSVLRWKIKLLV